jgi:hypothetical protein
MRSLRGLLRSVLALTSAAVLFWPSAALAAPPPSCAPILPLDDVAVGMQGTGWTVAEGTEPETFDVEVLGIAPGLVAPGRDIIIARISGPLVDSAGGVWAGMSGSPIYVDEDGDLERDDLIGALAYGFSFGPSNVVGLTPAEDMERVLNYPSGSFRKAGFPARVELSRALVSKIARLTRTPLPEVDGSLVRLKVPFSVSGVASERMRKVRKMLRRQHVAAIPYAGTSASISAVSSIDGFRPGDNFAAALSYGDLTFAGIGTTTYVCDGQALAFGHPFLFAGRVALGASGADAITIVPDPVFTPFKFANVEGIAGIVDQDRLAGIRAVDGEVESIPIDTAVTSIDTLNARTGQTNVVLESEFPFLAFAHLFSNIDSVFDKIGAGSSTVMFRINGTRANGPDWKLTRNNMYTSDFDLSIESSLELVNALDLIANNPFEKVHFTSVQATASVQETVDEYALTDVKVCRFGVCRTKDEISAFPGETIHLLATLTPSDGTDPQEVELSLTIPPRMRFAAEIEVTGGAGDCFEGECGPGAGADVESFDDLLWSLRRQPTNNVLTATLRSGLTGRARDKDNVSFEKVVRGSRFIFVNLGGAARGIPVG